MPRGVWSPGTANYIRDVLMLLGESFPHQIYKEVKRWCEVDGYKPPTYKGVRRILRLCVRLGLVEQIKREQDLSKPYLYPHSYYRIVEGMQYDPRWRDPQTALYDPEKFAKRTEFHAKWSSKSEYMTYVSHSRTG